MLSSKNKFSVCFVGYSRQYSLFEKSIVVPYLKKILDQMWKYKKFSLCFDIDKNIMILTFNKMVLCECLCPASTRKINGPFEKIEILGDIQNITNAVEKMTLNTKESQVWSYKVEDPVLDYGKSIGSVIYGTNENTLFDYLPQELLEKIETFRITGEFKKLGNDLIPFKITKNIMFGGIKTTE